MKEDSNWLFCKAVLTKIPVKIRCLKKKKNLVDKHKNDKEQCILYVRLQVTLNLRNWKSLEACCEAGEKFWEKFQTQLKTILKNIAIMQLIL